MLRLITEGLQIKVLLKLIIFFILQYLLYKDIIKLYKTLED